MLKALFEKHQSVEFGRLHTKERNNEGEADSGEDERSPQKNVEPETVGDSWWEQLLYASCQRIHQQSICAMELRKPTSINQVFGN